MRTDRKVRQVSTWAAILSAACYGFGFSQAQTAENPSGQEKCYGVAPAGENDGIDNQNVPGTSTIDFQGNAWVWVESGTCLRLALPVQPDGSPRRGSIEAIDRDRP